VNQTIGQYHNKRHAWNDQKADINAWDTFCRKQIHAHIKNTHTPQAALVATLLPLAACMSIYNGPPSTANAGNAFLPGATASPGPTGTYSPNNPAGESLLNAGAAGIGTGLVHVANGRTGSGLKLLMVGAATGLSGAAIGAIGGYLSGKRQCTNTQETPLAENIPAAEALQNCLSLCSVTDLDNEIQAVNQALESDDWKTDIEGFSLTMSQIFRILSATQSLVNAQEIPRDDASRLSGELGTIRTQRLEPYIAELSNYSSSSIMGNLEILQIASIKKTASAIASLSHAMEITLNDIYLRRYRLAP
jgi:hypothetical protein